MAAVTSDENSESWAAHIIENRAIFQFLTGHHQLVPLLCVTAFKPRSNR